MNAKSSRPTRPRRGLPEWVAPVAVVGVLLVLVGALSWYLLFKDPVATRRPVADTTMLMLPPPPPPPPPPEPEPEPEPEPKLEEEPMPEPEPFEEAPTPAEEDAPPTPDVSDPVTMDTDAQAGTDSWGIQKGSGGGSIGTGAGSAGNVSYGRYLGYILQQTVARDERVRRHAFQLQVDIWIEADGTLSRVELVRGSGNQEADEAVLEVLRKLGKVDERPPLSLSFPARVLVQGRRPG